MMQQGGVSKATKTVNLSEDIFAGARTKGLSCRRPSPVATSAGMDFTLRGEGRSIKHSEYFHLAKAARVKEASVMLMLENDRCSHGEFRILAALTRIILCRAVTLASTLSWASSPSSLPGQVASLALRPDRKRKSILTMVTRF